MNASGSEACERQLVQRRARAQAVHATSCLREGKGGRGWWSGGTHEGGEAAWDGPRGAGPISWLSAVASAHRLLATATTICRPALDAESSAQRCAVQLEMQSNRNQLLGCIIDTDASWTAV